MRNEALDSDIRWFRDKVIYYMGDQYHLSKTLSELCLSDVMKNIISSYGERELYKEDLERIIVIAQMLE